MGPRTCTSSLPLFLRVFVSEKDAGRSQRAEAFVLTMTGHKVTKCDLMITRDHKWRMPATYLKVIMQEASAANLPVESLLAATDLTQETLLTSDEPVSFASTLQVLSNAERLLGPGWHLLLAMRLTVPSHGPLGFAVVTAPNMRSSIDVLLRFMSTRAPFLWSAGTAEGDQFVLRFHEA